MKRSLKRLINGVHQRWNHYQGNRRWQALTAEVNRKATPSADSRPVIFFNASTRLQAMSQNAAYSLLAAQAVKLQGVPVLQFVCNGGMERCVLGSNRDDHTVPPPCDACTRQSRAVFRDMDTRWLTQRDYPELTRALVNLSTTDLEKFTYRDIPLGFWAVNSLALDAAPAQPGGQRTDALLLLRVHPFSLECIHAIFGTNEKREPAGSGTFQRHVLP